MFVANTIGIISDDLTGANDTALQFHMRGCNTQVVLDYTCDFTPAPNTQAWAISTESRNVAPDEAIKRVHNVTKNVIEKLNADYIYKKIDSTLRGNIGVEILETLEVLEWDAAIILPAYPNEGRITVGGYHLLKGQPIERTELARDPHSPISDSYIPSIIRKKLPLGQKDLIGIIQLETIVRGAGPILLKINELVKAGKKLIIADAASVIDIEQVVLAIEKSNYKLLPCGSAGMAQALSKIWIAELENHKISKTIPKHPKLVISGSATKLVAQQIDALKESEEIDNTYFISLTIQDILEDKPELFVNRILQNLKDENIVVVHSSNITLDENALSREIFEHEYTRETFITKIVDYLAQITKMVTEQKDLILLTIGGETSFRCCKAIDSKTLQIIDDITPAIPLTLDTNGQWIVTKSGNLGNQNTIIEVLKYFEKFN